MKRFLIALITLLSSVIVHAQTATITGVVRDGDANDFLIGASVLVKGTTQGTIANANGRYSLIVPAGKVVIVCDFLGYKTQEFEVDIPANQVKVLDITLFSDTTVLEGVVVSAQAKGQAAAINSQINAAGILNAVSEEKLSELPDVNVADAIGRLPGLMIQRDGGEGQKIIIRGLDPKYNTVAINGMNAPSTSTTDRSTDLNMISPDMIAGAEVMKANTADKDADGLGGTVNLIMKDAPYGLRVAVQGETGYHSQINNLGRYKAGITASNRFFEDKFGVILAAAFDRTDRSNDTFSASYDVNGSTPTPGYDYVRPWLTTTSLQSNLEIRTRYNVNLNFDLDLGNGNKIKFSNIFSNMHRDRDIRSKRYNFDGARLRYAQTDVQSSTANLSNIIQGEFNIAGSKLDVGAGHSSAWMDMPWSNELEFRINTPFITDISTLEAMAPYDAIAPEHVNESDITQWHLYNGKNSYEDTNERELSAWLDWTTPFRIGNWLNGYVKAGAKYRQKDRSAEIKQYYRRFDLSGGYEPAFNNMPDLTHSGAKDGTQIGIMDFLDDSYVNKGNFLRGLYPNCDFNFALNEDMMRLFYETNQEVYYRLFAETVKKDYTGHEEIYAGYLMTELDFGKWVTFIPGVRYDYSYLRYTGYSGANVDDSESNEQQFEFNETEDSERFGYLLPQIHLKVKPTRWMDLRLAYTQTLSRPDYDLLSPRTIIKPSSNTVTWSRTNLKPALSTNYDVTLSFYPKNWGLFTVSAFYKNIDNFIYSRTAVVLDNTSTAPENFGLTPSYNGAIITYPLNSPTTATIKGVEVEAQIMFHNLDNFLKGFVISTNFTLMDSKMKYHTTSLSRAENPDFGKVPGAKPFIQVNNDVAYEDRLLSQPAFLFNASLGYDYKKFSARVSCNYQDGVLVTAQQRSDAADKEITLPFMKWDAQLKYTFNKHLSLYATWSNINLEVDRKVRYITNYPMKTEYYGTTAYIGIKYNIF